MKHMSCERAKMYRNSLSLRRRKFSSTLSTTVHEGQRATTSGASDAFG
jgi:DNA-binding transcriptional regulator YiaG